jgi:alpha-ketoglutarate-dependent taurine dioxygenase
MTTPSPFDARAARRRVAVSAAQERVTVAHSPYSIISVAQPVVPSVDLQHWVRASRDRVEALLGDRGAILFRGFQLSGPEDFQNVVRAWSPQLLNYTYGSTPRSRSAVAGVYTSTEYPADQSIPQHNEMSYALIWPKHLWFYCDTAARAGGATPLADGRRVINRLDGAVRSSFADRGVRYIRNYGTGFDLRWQQAFETDSRADVEALCRAQGIEFAWRGQDQLRTSQVCQAVIRHPGTGAELWFNQAHLFHTSALAADVRAELLAGDHSELPRQAYYGDGKPIADSVLDEIRAAYDSETVREPWQDGDILLIDNMLVSHGRDPYEGPRRVLVAMTDEHRQATGDRR